MLSAEARVVVLDGGAISAKWLSLHSGFPGMTGANELAIGRAAITWQPANPYRKASNAIGITVGSGLLVAWIGMWDAATGGSFQGTTPLRGHPLEFYAVDATDRIHIPGGHPHTDGSRVVFFGGTPPTPLVEGTIYVTRDAAADNLRVTDIAGGSPINITNAAATAAGCVISAYAPLQVGTASTVVTIDNVTLRLVRNSPPVWS